MALLCLAPACAQDKPLPDPLFKRWVHSFEEDKNGVKVYRPAGYEFPPARGREGFEIRKNGDFIQYDIAPGDGSRPVAGRWKRSAAGAIRVSLKDGGTLTLTILSCEDQVLTLKK